MPQIIDNTALLRLIEIELVSQYRRFMRKNLAVSPKTCRFNSWTATPDGGFIRMCQCPRINASSISIQKTIDDYVNKPCTTLNHARKCPLYQHYTGVPVNAVVERLTEDFLLRLEDPVKRATSFKTLHTLWIILHESEAPKLSWTTRITLGIMARVFQHKYLAYLIKVTPKADLTWGKLSHNFKFVLSNSQE